MRFNSFIYMHTIISAPMYKPQDLRGRLDAALEQVDTLRDHLQERDSERRALEQKIQEVRRESEEAKKALEENIRDSNRYRSSLEVISRYSLMIHHHYSFSAFRFQPVAKKDQLCVLFHVF